MEKDFLRRSSAERGNHSLGELTGNDSTTVYSSFDLVSLFPSMNNPSLMPLVTYSMRIGSLMSRRASGSLVQEGALFTVTANDNAHS